MEQWEQIKGVSTEFEVFFNNIPKSDRAKLARCPVREYEAYIKQHFTGVVY